MRPARPRRSAALVVPALLGVVVALLAGCSSEPQGSNADPDQVDAVTAPELGACRVLSPEDVAQPSNATRTVPCREEHTAQTFAIGELPDDLDDAGYDDREVGAFVFSECTPKFERFLGADESLVLRTMLSWAWFRPSAEAWEDGARWYRCDVVGGGHDAEELLELPRSARGLLTGRPDDRWMLCADGETVAGSPKVPCTEQHTWRAVTTIKVGEPEEEYPGDRLVEVTTRDYCSDSVGAWLNYPVDYEFGFTWFREAEWESGNRRSVCWAKTED